ncbi:redoxin domain-containing protein [Chitinophaga agrisoli]|uniref:Redoxin domain-containing protein n=1 Tax=Chitinophaga agrisoli TaxID=2607653 RepID=A0A5B2VN16_9BACT|nr:redoxin domain-containing protein [Chitinophaga agrisoli]KAA2240481.1 redoxin domain-containing protein [Chitinophaga agrisoli]
MSLTVGTKAPEFALFNTEKQKVSLGDYQGKNLVILFFPMAFTSTCTAELCSIRDSISVYNDLNTDVVGISVDSPFTLGKFKAEQQLNFPLLSDFNKEASQAYGAFYDTFVLELKGVSKRAAFVADKDGNLRYAEVLEKASDLPDFEAIKQTLAGLQ